VEVIDFRSSDNEYKDSAQKARGILKVHIDSESRLYITLGTRGRGGRGLGRFHEIIEMFIDQDNRLFAGFVLTDKSGSSYACKPFAKLLNSANGEALGLDG
jgi:hypothetical protein